MCGTDKDCGCGCDGDKPSAGVDLGRRRILRGLAGLGLTAGLGLSPIESYAAKAELLGSVSKGMGDCFDHEIVGICTSGIPPVPTGFRVRHYLPVAMIECINSTDDSVILGGSTAKMTGARRLNTAGPDRETGFDVNVWTIGDTLRAALTYGFSYCGWCSSSYAMDPGAKTDGPSAATGILNTADNLMGCGVSPAALIAGLKSLTGGVGGLNLPLAYSSGLDLTNWQTGCRDRFEASIRAPLVPAMCSVKVPDSITSRIKSVAGIQGSLLPGDISRGDVCIGNLGPLYPRQMNAMGKTDPTGALVTAFRALHMAHFELGTFNYRVDPDDAKFQMLYPNVGNSCFRLNDPVEHLENAIGVSDDGRYAFIFWTPVTCCIDFDEYGCTAATG